jgi:hypothetical protein
VRVPRIKPRRILAFTAGFALVATCAVAGPKRQTPAPVPNYRAMKTAEEKICEAWGNYAYTKAVDRDRGVTITNALAYSRYVDRANQAEAFVTHYHERILSILYEYPAITPVRAQQDTEVWCLTYEDRNTQTQQTTQENTTKYRY